MGSTMGIYNLSIISLAFAMGLMCTEARSTNEVSRDIPVRCTTHTVTQISCRGADMTNNLVPHPDDCQLFYYCLSDDLPPICRQCPSGLHFNPEKHVCDQPKQARCRSSTTTSTTTTTTRKPSCSWWWC